MNKLLFTVFHDKNTFLKEYTTTKSKQDKEMEVSILFNLYTNLLCYYLKGHYLDCARDVVKDLEKLGHISSIFYFRKAQVLVADSRSTLKEL